MGETTVQCSGCGRELAESPSAPAEEREPCPYCGSLARTFHSSTTATITISASVGWEHIRTFYEHHRGWQAVTLGLALLGAVAGLFVGGWLGVAAALALGIAGYWAGPRAVMRVQRVERGHSG